MRAVWVIAKNTFQETIRDRVMYNILFFAIFIIAISLVISGWSLNQQVKLIKDFGLAAMSLFGLLIAIFVGIRLLYQDMERKTIYMLVSKPIRRWQIVVGKYAGLALTVFANLVVMTISLYVVDFLIERQLDWGLLAGILLIFFEILLVIAWAFLFSSFTSPMLSAVLTVLIYVTGHLSPALKLFTQLHPENASNKFLLFLYAILPNLENFNIKTALVEHLRLPELTAPSALLYGIAYTGILLIITSLILEKRNFK